MGALEILFILILILILIIKCHSFLCAVSDVGEWAEDEEEAEDDSGKDGDRTGDNSCHKHSQVAATLTW